MKINTLLIISVISLSLSAQEGSKNALSTSLLRLEGNSQTFGSKLEVKFLTGLEYQRFVNKWSFGFKFEHGLNKIEEFPKYCSDCIYGIGYMREDNGYLTGDYSIIQLWDSHVIIQAGIGIYYSNLEYSGEFVGGFSGIPMRKYALYETVGFAPRFSLTYFATKQLFLSVHSNVRYGWSKQFDGNTGQRRKINETVLTAPELRIGVCF